MCVSGREEARARARARQFSLICVVVGHVARAWGTVACARALCAASLACPNPCVRAWLCVCVCVGGCTVPSCWSFGTAETLEGAHFVKTGELVELSQQELMDCSWPYGNFACDGGEDFQAYQCAWLLVVCCRQPPLPAFATSAAVQPFARSCARWFVHDSRRLGGARHTDRSPP